MAKVSLTDLGIQKLTPGTYWDTSLPGFGIRIGKRTKTFVVMRGKERKLVTLGHYPSLTLRAARTSAKLEMTQVSSKGVKTLPGALQAFTEASQQRTRPDTLKQYLSYLNQMDFQDFPTYPQIQEALKKWDGKPYAQNYAHASIRNFLNFCIEHEYIDRSPLFRKLPPNKVKSRDRVLSDEELGRIWRCTEDNTYGRILRLLILTGQRRMEVRNLKKEDIQDGHITFHTKGDKVNVLPITPLIEENLILPFQFNNWSDSSRIWKPVVAYNKHEMKIFPSVTAAALATGCLKTNISKCCRRKRKSGCGYTWRYAIIGLV